MEEGSLNMHNRFVPDMFVLGGGDTTFADMAVTAICSVGIDSIVASMDPQPQLCSVDQQLNLNRHDCESLENTKKQFTITFFVLVRVGSKTFNRRLL